MATAASAETRSLKFYHLHTREKAEIVYKRNGRYDPEGLKKINYILRDWRRNEPVKMDPRLLDMVWEAYRVSGANSYIQVICGYRAPATNSMLRSRSRGVAQKSQHMLGKAIDFYIPGVPLKKLRDIGLKMQGGGVGYYPTSGSPFVHLDVGNVRHWPGISRQELARVFPNGKTLHVPSDGRPLPGYEQAVASYKSRKANGSTAIALASMGGSSKKSGGLLAAFFGGGADEADDEADVVAAASEPKPKVKQAKPPLPGITIVPPDKAERANIPAVEDAPVAEEPKEETPETIIAALPARSVPLPAFAPRPKTDVGEKTPATPETVPFGVADAAAENGEAVQVAAVEQTPTNVPFSTADATALAAYSEPGASTGVPVPTWRPEHGVAAKADGQQSVLMALAETAQGGPDKVSVLPSQRPDEIRAVLEQTASSEVATDAYQVASLSMPRLAPRSAFNDPAVDSATPRQAIAALPAGSDPAAAIGGSVKTTRKESRASAIDAKPDPKAVVTTAQPSVARWAIHSTDYVATVKNSTTAPSFAYNLVRTAPKEVYTAGFQSEDQVANTNKFSGTAVKFLSVARFGTK
ncbi:DUF882 domain-containing protein [Mesorhizobium sp. BE184]|uniref:DUF882 domain-containing protein n=1 Tax=Mesorhizobium sp. BE184 TaxID=2817714 RepID=UPI00286D21EF|nr:DUF882 domain-containing protein [Mesorhizobium sp. BE184]